MSTAIKYRWVISAMLFVLVPLFWLADRVTAQSYGSAYTVDGNSSEWNLTDDFFGNFYDNRISTNPVTGKLYLHMDPSTGTLYGLVLREASLQGLSLTEHISFKNIATNHTTYFHGGTNVFVGGVLVGYEFSTTALGIGEYLVNYYDYKGPPAHYYGSEGLLAMSLKWLDLKVTKVVDNATPATGADVIFTITIENLSSVVDATNIGLSDLLNANFAYQSTVQNNGFSSVSISGGNNISMHANTIAASSSAVCKIKVKANGSADNSADNLTLNEYDTNSANNSSTISVTVSGSSGSGSGGLESNGDLAVKIAWRNFTRIKENNRPKDDCPENLVVFTDDLAQRGIISAAGQTKAHSELVDYIPELGPFKSKAFITTPGDLLEITNAIEVFSADYFSEAGRRFGALMAMKTEGDVYEHTKLVCDRLSGATLTYTELVTLHGIPMIMNRLLQANGDVDYAISFIAVNSSGKFKINSRWHPRYYPHPEEKVILNFQVWTLTRQSTLALANEVLKRMNKEHILDMQSCSQPEIPRLYVRKGEYLNGSLGLQIWNGAGAKKLTISGSKTVVEGGEQIPFSVNLDLNPMLTDQEISLEIGQVFDIFLEVENNTDPVKDFLYFADGAWGIDYMPDGAIVDDYNINPATQIVSENTISLSRDITIDCRVRDYLSVFRTLKAGAQAVDCSGMNCLSFDGSGSGVVEVVIVRQPVGNWSEQYRASVILTADEKLHHVKLLSNIGFSDVESVAFNFIGDAQNYQQFSMSVKNLRFEYVDNQLYASDLNNYYLDVYPNPIRDFCSISFDLPEMSSVKICLQNTMGQVVKVLSERHLSAGSHQLSFDLSLLDAGFYFLNLQVNDHLAIRQLVKQ